MIRLDLSYFYRVGLELNRIRQVPDDATVGAVWWELFYAQQSLKVIFNSSILIPHLRSSVRPGQQLEAAINDVLQTPMEQPLTQWTKANLVRTLDNFEVVLQNELAVADAYIVGEKAPYSTIQLVAHGERLFSPEIVSKVPGAIEDLRSAGKCLAFELGTACGFHTMRAMEAVLRRYWEAVTGNKPHPKQRNLGVYLRGMEALQCGNAKVIAALQQIKDLHRNAISHPEDTLSVNEAISLIGMARSVVDAMLKEIPEPVFELTPPDGEAYLPNLADAAGYSAASDAAAAAAAADAAAAAAAADAAAAP